MPCTASFTAQRERQPAPAVLWLSNAHRLHRREGSVLDLGWGHLVIQALQAGLPFPTEGSDLLAAVLPQ